MYHTKQLLASLSLAAMLAGSFSPAAQALTITEAVNSIQSTPPATLPGVSNPR
jgi:hypothetical protein